MKQFSEKLRLKEAGSVQMFFTYAKGNKKTLRRG